MRKYPVGMVLGGRYNWADGIFKFQDGAGLYWSSSASAKSTSACNLTLNGMVYPADSYSKFVGLSLRCLAKKGIISLKTLRLPTGNTTGEFQSLYNQYPTYDQMRKYPVGMVLGGHYVWIGGTLNWQGTFGYYWSSSAHTSTTSAYNLALGGINSTVGPASNSYKYHGRSLRCLALLHQKRRRLQSQIHTSSQPVTLLENTKHSTITIIAGLL